MLFVVFHFLKKNALKISIHSAKSSEGSTVVLPRHFRGDGSKLHCFRGHGNGTSVPTEVSRKIGYFHRHGSTVAVKFFFWKGEQNVFPVSTSQSAISILLRDMVKTLEYDVFTIIISNFYLKVFVFNSKK